MSEERTAEAGALMAAYAARTGLTCGAQRRYLWTDAFAVCNFLALGHEALARRTVTAVHNTLGRFRDDDARTGWISGLSASDGEAHPTRGGLRIGKPLPERRADEPFSERLEWERDGQYFHYLTKWMHALAAIGDTGWATELAIAAHRGFVREARGVKRLVWKMSTDLTRPLVPSMGHHDPLDGFVTAMELGDVPRAVLDDYRAMFEPSELATADPLGLGGLLIDAYRVHRLVERGAWRTDLVLLEPLLAAALLGLLHYTRSADFEVRVDRRLPFRELGLAIGLAALQRMPRSAVAQLAAFLPLRAEIEQRWREPVHRELGAWVDHADINDVMLATCLVPSGFLR